MKPQGTVARRACLVVGILLACSSREQPRARAVPPPKLGSLPSYESPASWRYHPHAVAAMHARAELGPGRVLFAGARGERWLYDAGAGRLESAVPAPEELVAILSGPSSSYSFVGRSGATYRADEPLGRFVASTVPFEPLAEVAGSNRVLLAVRRDRKLVRSTDAGASFVGVGPRDIAFVDVELDASGNALALGSPEVLFQSGDGGTSWQRLDGPTRGAVGLERDVASGAIRVMTVLGALRFGSKGIPEPAAPSSPGDALPKGIRPLAGPNAGALAEGKAAWAGPGYLEARLVDSSKGSWVLLSGPLKGPFATRPLGEAKACRSVRLAGYDRFVRLACFRGSPELTQEVELSTSSDGGAIFAREKPDVYAKLSDFRMAVGADGAWLVSGACPPATQAPGCAPSGILHVRPAERVRAGSAASPQATVGSAAPAKPRLELAVSAAPGLSDSALALVFGADGKTAFAAARTTKGAGLALFASIDGGRSFEPREIGGRFDSNDEPAGRVTLSAGSDGTLALVAARAGSASLLVADDQGRVISASAPPESALVGAAGLSAVAVTADGRVFESLDGGAAWEPAGNLPTQLCDDTGCDVPIACTTAGCVVGDELTRVGWGASDLPEVGLSRASGRPARASGAVRLKTPIACTLQGPPFRPLYGASRLPGADQAALGDAAWFAIGEDAATASATLYQARGGQHPRVETVTLLAPVADAVRYAFTVAPPQIEGGAALRYPIPDTRSAGVRVRDVEVAWLNLFEKKPMRARIPDGGEYFPGDFERSETGRRSVGARIAKPDLLSIAERGLYLRLHASPTKAAGSRQPTFFLDGKSVQSLPPITFPSGILQGGNDEMARFGEAHLALYLQGSGPSLVRGVLRKGAWEFDAVTVGLPNPRAFGLEQTHLTTYLGGRMAIRVESVDPVALTAEGRLFALRADGTLVDPPVQSPTLRDLPERPVACTPGVRESTGRVVARALPGTRHPVIVSDAVDPPRAMITGDFVLHGTPESPCAAALEVETVRAGQERVAEESGILLFDDLEHAWLLRRVDSAEVGAPHIEYRSMSCRFEPGLEIPEELLGEPTAGDADR
jgi:hypothetical protein